METIGFALSMQITDYINNTNSGISNSRPNLPNPNHVRPTFLVVRIRVELEGPQFNNKKKELS